MVRQLHRKKLFIVTVESCTGGGLANAITNVAGASRVMAAGFITYSNRQKEMLGVPADLIERHTVYSVEVAKSMAEAGLRNAVRADVGVGITGSISRIDMTNPNSQRGVVYIAVRRGDSGMSKKIVVDDKGRRWEAKERIIEEALRMVLKEID